MNENIAGATIRSGKPYRLTLYGEQEVAITRQLSDSSVALLGEIAAEFRAQAEREGKTWEPELVVEAIDPSAATQ